MNKGGAKSGPDRGGLGEAKGSSGRGSAKANPGRPGTSKGKPNRIGGKANPGRPSGGGPKNGPKGGPKSGPKKNAGTRNAKGRKNASNKVSKQVGIIYAESNSR